MLDRLSSGPGKGATGWSTRTLLSVWWSDPGGNDRRAAAGGAGRAGSNTASAGRARAPAFANTPAAGNSSAASSYAAGTMAFGGNSVVSVSGTTAARTAVHANTRGRFSIRRTPDARNSSSACRASDAWPDLAVLLGTGARTAFAVWTAPRKSGAGLSPIVYSAGSAAHHAGISPIVYSAGSAARHAGISSIVYTAGSAASDASASSATRACCVVDGWRSGRFACARRAASDQSVPRA